MKSLKLLVLFHIIASFILADALDDDYDDGFVTLPINRTNNTENLKEIYSALSAQLNCSKLVVNHKGVKIEEILPDSILKPTLPPTTNTTLPLEANVFTLAETTKEYENVTTSTQSYEYQDLSVFNFDFVDSSILNEYLDFSSEVDKNQENQTVTEKVLNSQDNSTLIDKKNESDRIFRKIDYSSSGSKNDLKPPDCWFTFNDTGDIYNWFKIISQSGGVPGEVNATRLTPNVTVVLEPCHRPVTNTSPPLGDLLYEYESIEFMKFYRREKAFLRFAGTPSEFVDIMGQLVWAPPKQENRFYRLSYRKDDTGFYVNVRPGHKCVFEKDPIRVNCNLVKDFYKCTDGKSLSPGLLASLAG